MPAAAYSTRCPRGRDTCVSPYPGFASLVICVRLPSRSPLSRGCGVLPVGHGGARVERSYRQAVAQPSAALPAVVRYFRTRPRRRASQRCRCLLGSRRHARLVSRYREQCCHGAQGLLSLLRSAALDREHLADGIQGPRIYALEGLPAGPDWSDVRRLFAALDQKNPTDIRDRPILMLMAIYGLRAGEVAKLRLEHLDWEHDGLMSTDQEA